MITARKIGPALAVPAAALLLSGCGGDEEETTSIPTTTVPTAATAQTATEQTTPSPTQTTAKVPKPTPAAPTGEPGSCEVGEPIRGLKFKGIACDEAATVANAWNGDQDRCNTIDDPESPEGYNRTCAVEDYTCRAKRDVKSDARFVACAKGPAQVRFTWAP